jgi:hypothetical protein
MYDVLLSTEPAVLRLIRHSVCYKLILILVLFIQK